MQHLFGHDLSIINLTCKMKTRNMCTIVFAILAIISCLNGNKDVGFKIRQPKRIKYNSLVRCTRRFTPGLCLEPVIPVWTFVFQLQNCTERYGCRQDGRTNRFSTHARCARRCRPLLDFYTEVLSREPHNLTAYMRSHTNKSGRRDSADEEDGTDLQEEEYDSRTEDNVKGPAPSVADDSVDHDDGAVIDIDDVYVQSVDNDGLIFHEYFHD